MPVEGIRVLRLLFRRCVKSLCPLGRNLRGPNKNKLIKKTQKESGVSCCTISGGVAPLLRPETTLSVDAPGASVHQRPVPSFYCNNRLFSFQVVIKSLGCHDHIHGRYHHVQGMPPSVPHKRMDVLYTYSVLA